LPALIAAVEQTAWSAFVRDVEDRRAILARLPQQLCGVADCAVDVQYCDWSRNVFVLQIDQDEAGIACLCRRKVGSGKLEQGFSHGLGVLNVGEIRWGNSNPAAGGIHAGNKWLGITASFPPMRQDY
jgi:hypothetical protein